MNWIRSALLSTTTLTSVKQTLCPQLAQPLLRLLQLLKTEVNKFYLIQPFQTHMLRDDTYNLTSLMQNLKHFFSFPIFPQLWYLTLQHVNSEVCFLYRDWLITNGKWCVCDTYYICVSVLCTIFQTLCRLYYLEKLTPYINPQGTFLISVSQ